MEGVRFQVAEVLMSLFQMTWTFCQACPPGSDVGERTFLSDNAWKMSWGKYLEGPSSCTRLVCRTWSLILVFPSPILPKPRPYVSSRRMPT